ncbi:MAG TPA: type I pullulanase [Neobacillus sp.]|jgi:pullulanase
MTSIERTFLAYLDEMKIITILLPLTYHHGMSSLFSIIDGTQSIPLKILESAQIESQMKYVCQLEEEIPFRRSLWVMDEHGSKTDLQIGAVTRTDLFDEGFYYDGDDLGVTFESNQTHFKLWAPTATQVKLKLRPPNGSFSELLKMKLEDRGIWSISLNRDVETYQYSFLALVNLEWREAVDPYARAVTANGVFGVIINLEKTKRVKAALPRLENAVDAIIYETHIRDFTIHPKSGASYKGLYLGAGETKTKGKDGEPTGLSYLKDLGITHIEFLPFHDFGGINELQPQCSYNWGYNPIHFNVPDGSYSTDPSNPCSRITELKQLIDNIHSVGIRIIMDVVYNHVYIRENSPFEKIVPGYYFRHNEFGLPSNGTGVGNDLASERKMVRKFILDSVRFWIEEYHIDGFRFDLMGILDVDTMNAVRKMCDRLEKGMLLIGEGWNLNTPLPQEQKAIIRNQAKLPEIAMFNDRFRDTMKGSTFNLFDKGYCFGNEHYFEDALEGMTGSIGYKQRDQSLFNEPSQSVNFVECHDNHTMWDKLLFCQADVEDAVRMKYHRLATGMVILAQGIPFLHSGQEFFRTKNGDGNSYRSPDAINQLDWDRKCQYIENVQYIKELIGIRKTLPAFRMRTAAEIRNNMHFLPAPEPIIVCLYQSQYGEYQEVILLINPCQMKHIVTIPDGEWFLLADHDHVEISSNRILGGGKINIEPVCLMILAKK